CRHAAFTAATSDALGHDPHRPVTVRPDGRTGGQAHVNGIRSVTCPTLPAHAHVQRSAILHAALDQFLDTADVVTLLKDFQHRVVRRSVRPGRPTEPAATANGLGMDPWSVRPIGADRPTDIDGDRPTLAACAAGSADRHAQGTRLHARERRDIEGPTLRGSTAPADAVCKNAGRVGTKSPDLADGIGVDTDLVPIPSSPAGSSQLDRCSDAGARTEGLSGPTAHPGVTATTTDRLCMDGVGEV